MLRARGELLAELPRKPIADERFDNVRCGTCRKAADKGYWSCWIVESPSRARDGGKRNSTRSHMQGGPAAKLHRDVSTRVPHFPGAGTKAAFEFVGDRRVPVAALRD